MVRSEKFMNKIIFIFNYPLQIVTGFYDDRGNPSKKTSKLKETTARGVFSPSALANLIFVNIVSGHIL